MSPSNYLLPIFDNLVTLSFPPINLLFHRVNGGFKQIAFELLVNGIALFVVVSKVCD